MVGPSRTVRRAGVRTVTEPPERYHSVGMDRRTRVTYEGHFAFFLRRVCNGVICPITPKTVCSEAVTFWKSYGCRLLHPDRDAVSIDLPRIPFVSLRDCDDGSDGKRCTYQPYEEGVHAWKGKKDWQNLRQSTFKDLFLI